MIFLDIVISPNMAISISSDLPIKFCLFLFYNLYLFVLLQHIPAILQLALYHLHNHLLYVFYHHHTLNLQVQQLLLTSKPDAEAPQKLHLFPYFSLLYMCPFTHLISFCFAIIIIPPYTYLKLFINLQVFLCWLYK